MLTTTFHNLAEERKGEIISVCLDEFARHGYDLTSTNHIVSRLAIAKGTFFKYFVSKEALYLHLFEEIMHELAALQNSPSLYCSRDLFMRIDELFRAFLRYAAQKPQHYRFVLRGTVDSSASIYDKVEQLRREISGKNVTAIFEGVDWQLYAYPEAEVVEMFHWLMSGMRASAILALSREFSLVHYTAHMNHQLSLLHKVLHKGIYR